MKEITEQTAYVRPTHAVTHKIREWRTYRDMTMEKLAHESGFTTSMISQLERGRAIYTQRNLEKIAAALDAEPWQLLAYDPANPPAPKDFYIDGFNADFWARFDDEGREKAARLILTNYDQAVRLAIELFAKEVA